MSASSKTRITRSHATVVTNRARAARFNSALTPTGYLQRSAVNANPVLSVPSNVHETLRSRGQPLDMATRAFMEPRFGCDFSHVRVHTDSQAASSVLSVAANAYAVGNHIVFGAGKFAPHLTEGKRLIAHELVHTIQDGAGSPAAAHSIAPDGS